MLLSAKARESIRVMGEAATIVPALGYKMAEDDEKVSLGALFEDTVAGHSDNVMLIFEARQWTYSEFNDDVNQLARALANRGVSRGDTVAMFVQNRAEYKGTSLPAKLHFIFSPQAPRGCPRRPWFCTERYLQQGMEWGPDVWDEFKSRFGVSRICETYGSSEGNVPFVNILNKNRTIGAAISKVGLVKYDNENDEILRDEARSSMHYQFAMHRIVGTNLT